MQRESFTIGNDNGHENISENCDVKSSFHIILEDGGKAKDFHFWFVVDIREIEHGEGLEKLVGRVE